MVAGSLGYEVLSNLSFTQIPTLDSHSHVKSAAPSGDDQRPLRADDSPLTTS